MHRPTYDHAQHAHIKAVLMWYAGCLCCSVRGDLIEMIFKLVRHLPNLFASHSTDLPSFVPLKTRLP
eukprot:scaffold48902_cov39-Prasinocladus_malaysianus.AAC.1